MGEECSSHEDISGGASDGSAKPNTTTTSSSSSSSSSSSMSRVLHKDNFTSMRIIGQFNLGFIIGEYNGDLYILDQHACDEKYRFEKLQSTTKIHQQPLISPLTLETSVAQELTIMENLDVFENNGFKLAYNSSGRAGSRITVTSMPFSRGVRFGVEDINELASMLESHFGGGGGAYSDSIVDTRGGNKGYLMLKNDPTQSSSSSSSSSTGTSIVADKNKTAPSSNTERKNSHLRLPKLVSMYASRACRTAVMIGTALTMADMKKIVGKLQGIEQPWNCPHGRPTVRHLADMTSLRAEAAASAIRRNKNI